MIEVVLDGPGKNALSTTVMRAAIEQVNAAQGQPLLLRGAGDAFCAGLNLKEIASLDPKGMGDFLDLLDNLVLALFHHDAPTVACVHGHAIAGGCVLALACDLRVATTEAKVRIGLNEVPLGLIFPPRILKLARARLAPSHLRRVVLEGGLYSPTEALRLGLVNELSDDPLNSARTLLSRLAAAPRNAYLAAKRSLDAGALDLAPTEQEQYREMVLPHWSSDDMRNRMLLALKK